MRTIAPAFAFFILVIVAQACDDRDDNLDGANIRIENTSTLNFTRVVVGTERGEYENVGPDSFSDYLEYDLAYPLDTLTVETDSVELRFLPDSNPDTLPIGLYTYRIDISETGELELTFVLD